MPARKRVPPPVPSTRPKDVQPSSQVMSVARPPALVRFDQACPRASSAMAPDGAVVSLMTMMTIPVDEPSGSATPHSGTTRTEGMATKR